MPQLWDALLPLSGGADTPVHDKLDQDICRGYQG